LAFYDGDFSAAAQYYTRVLAQSPLDAETAIFLGRTFLKLGRPAEGAALATQLERWVLPPRLDLRLGLANLHLALGQTVRACAEYHALLPRLGDYAATDPERRDLAAACAAPSPQ
jgi:tetratricopeptide (TPR) repeat protein